jgi:heme exporter protein C
MRNMKHIWTVLSGATIIGFAVTFYLVFVSTPMDRGLGFTQKIFYVHVPCAWVAYLAFVIAGIGGIVYLLRRDDRWDFLAHASMEVGFVFTTLVIVTGPLWAKPTWGAYWVWDARLTTTLVLWMIQVGYLVLRSFMTQRDKAARSSAVLAIFGLVDIPVIHYSVRLWRGLHPDPVVMSSRGFGAGLPPEFLTALFVSLATFTLLFVLLVVVRYRIEATRADVASLHFRLNHVGGSPGSTDGDWR